MTDAAGDLSANDQHRLAWAHAKLDAAVELYQATCELTALYAELGLPLPAPTGAA